MTEAQETAGQIAYYFRAMKAARLREAAARLADRAREAAGPTRITSPHSFPRKSLPGDLRPRMPDPGRRFPGPPVTNASSFDHQHGLKRDTIAHLATGAFRTATAKIVLLGLAEPA